MKRYYYKSKDEKSVWSLKTPSKPKNAIQISEEEYKDLTRRKDSYI